MKTGQIMKSPRYRWFEPQFTLLGGGSYFTHAWGSIYVLSGRVAADLGAMRGGTLRHFANEGVAQETERHAGLCWCRCCAIHCSMHGWCLQPTAHTGSAKPCAHTPKLVTASVPCRDAADVTIGSWLLAFNATHYDDRRLCAVNCTAASIAVYDIPVCAGLCDAAVQLPQLHASPACHLPATSPTGGLPLLPPIFNFQQRSDPAWDVEAVRQLRAKRERTARGIKPSHIEYDTAQPH
jgi:hypothetical protein